MSQTNSYDAIVIGGGHNGLVAGAYLSRAGARTVLDTVILVCRDQVIEFIQIVKSGVLEQPYGVGNK